MEESKKDPEQSAEETELEQSKIQAETAFDGEDMPACLALRQKILGKSPFMS
jgi:hypothetical protein